MMLHFVQRMKQACRRPVRRLQRDSRKRQLVLECLEDRRLLTAQPLTDAGQPSIHEQYLLELINRGRSDPVTEAARYRIGLNDGLSPGTISTQAKPPLAFSVELIAAARGHSEWMLANDRFSHTGEGGSSPGGRMTAAGYVFASPWTWGENISWRGTVGAIDETAYVEIIAEGLFKSAGHRVNQLKPEFRESGVGSIQGDFTSSGMTWNALMVTEKFARSGNTTFMTGVVYDDTLVRNDQFYTPGEGLGAVTIEATRTSDSQVFTARTWASGGYSLALPSGTYTIVASGGSLSDPIVRAGVVIGAENVKVDFTPSDVSNIVPPIVPPPNPEPTPPPPPDPVTVALGANPQTVTQSGLVTLTGTVTGGNAARVQFYRDSNANGTWDSGDQLLGTDQEASNGWSVVVSSAAWPVGQQQLFARAQDQAGTWSNVAAVVVQVNTNQVTTPVVGGSGNVTVTVKYGDLVVTGDSLANSVQVRPGSAPGQWVVMGLGNTTINRLSQPATMTGVTRDVIIRMQSGDDILNAEDISVPRNLRVEMGAGNTESVFESIVVGGNATFYHGSGQRNVLTVTDSQVKGKVDFRGGKGADQAIFSRTTVGNDLVANLYGGADLLEVRSATIGRNLGVQTGSRARQEAKVWIGYGKDQVDDDVLTTIAQDAVVRGSAGNDRFEIRGLSTRRDLQVDTSSGDDVLDLLASSIGRNAQIKLTNGSNLAWIDEVTVSSRFGLDGGRSQDQVLIGSRAELGVRAGTSVINLGYGNDTLLLCGSTLAQLQVNTTSGNNDVYLECNTVTSRTTLSGGRGIDRLTEDLSLNDQLASLSVTNFEYELPKWDDLPS